MRSSYFERKIVVGKRRGNDDTVSNNILNYDKSKQHTK